MTEGEVCQDRTDSAQIGPPRAVRQREADPAGPRFGPRFPDPALSAIVGAEFGSHLGNVG